MPFRRDLEKKTAGATGGSREVNSLLHTLRGEQFRHEQNLRRSKAHLVAAASHSRNDPSLPFSDIFRFPANQRTDTARDEDGGTAPAPAPLPVIRDGHLEHGYPRGPVPGPPPPRSWSGLFRHDALQEGAPAAYDPSLDKSMPAFRCRALSLIFSHTPWSFGSSDVPMYESSPYADRDVSDSAVPPLTQICLRVLLAEFPDTAGFRDELLPAIGPYFKRDILRYTAVHEPLPNAKLYPLLEPEGHADGELIVVGPQATLQRDLLLSLSPTATVQREGGDEGEEDRGEGPSSSGHSSVGDTDNSGHASPADEDSWEAESSSQEVSPPLHTLVVLNAPVTTPTLFAFPLILTRLALLALPSPTPVHRLPRICPLLEVLDLSYNPWLNEPPGGKGVENSESIAQRIEWDKWARLRVLGLRGCDVPQEVIDKVNKGRWEEVEIVLEEHRTFKTSMSDVEAMMRSLRLTD
ncbi:hypothetical protein OH77DRAFT_1441328 [Trametes cingulata]|nr:hypothetical protein OH77DRAFT_1441328 [Trametes cingulata]